MKIESEVVHAGDRKRQKGVAVPSTTPIHLSSTFFYDSAEQLDRVMGGEEQGFSYSRYANPTNEALEELMSILERAHGALATASGMSAIQLAFEAALLDGPRRVVASRSIYGATISLLDQVLSPLGIDVTYVDICDLTEVEKAIGERETGCVFFESVSNPLLRVGDIARIADIARAAGATVVVDNTFATPVLIRPLELGAHIAVHSATKYLAGHGDVLGGILASDEEHYPSVRALSRIIGPVLGPFESYLTMRGVKTLALRFERQCENARALAEWLCAHPCIEHVYYCADPNHPDADNIRKFFAPGLFGAVLSFEMKGANKTSVMAFMDRLRMIVPGTSLGDVHTLLLYPVMASHRDISPKMRERMGIRENLVRVAVGIEALDDIVSDLDHALRPA